ncbi:MAG: flagellar motor protein MotB [Velocimicrobium sp.]
MARKKKQESGGGGAPAWMATFSDLMNLLLCFFVLLFAFSSVDAQKFAEIAASFNSSYSIFPGGSQAIGEGKMISQGVSQLDNLSEYYSEMASQAGQDSSDSETDQTETPKDSSDVSSDAVEQYKAQVEEQKKQMIESLYDEVTDATQAKKIADLVDVSMDSQYQFVQISLSGAILFDSGQAALRSEATPILSKLGTILKTYDKYEIKIEGHTDNRPIKTAKFDSNMWLSTARATKVFEYLTIEKGLNPKTLEASGRGEYEPIASNNTAKGRAKNRRVEIKIYNSVGQ